METKFNLKDKVYFMHDNKVTEGYIKGIHITCSPFDPPEFKKFMINDIKYDVFITIIKYDDRKEFSSKEIREPYLFSTKEELTASL